MAAAAEWVGDEMATEEEEVVVTEVWANNLMEELPLILEAAELYPYVALDTEFSGFLRQTPRFASPEERYQDVKYNVDRVKLIQIGLTFFDVAGGGSGRVRRRRRRRLTWQINLREFDVSCPTDARWAPSIDLLRGSGVDLERTREEGVDSDILSDVMLGCGWMLHLQPAVASPGVPAGSLFTASTTSHIC